MSAGELAPTPRLRWLERDSRGDESAPAYERVLQCWWAEDVPGYMRSEAKGEWRDVPVGIEAP